MTKLINWVTRSVSVFRLSSFLPYSQCHSKDDDADVVEEDDGHEGVHVALEITCAGELFGDVALGAHGSVDALHEVVEQEAKENANCPADTDIAQKMNSQVESGEGGGCGPQEEGDGDLAAAEEAGEEDGYGHSVAGMSGKEAETAASIASDDVDEVHELGVLCGSPTGYKRLDKT